MLKWKTEAEACNDVPHSRQTASEEIEIKYIPIQFK
jgi:hypothetical protein